MSLHQFKSKEEYIKEQKKKEILETLLKDDSVIRDSNNVYSGLQQNDDEFESEAYILGRMYERFGLNESLAKMAILKFGNYTKAIEFSDFYFKKMNGDINFYMRAVEIASKNGFSYTPKEVSMLEQEVMNSQNRLGIEPADREVRLYLNSLDLKTKKARRRIDIHEIGYRDEIEGSSHYFEHFDVTSLDRLED